LGEPSAALALFTDFRSNAWLQDANYHTMWDTAERFDYQWIGQAVEAVYAAVIYQTH